MLTETCKRRKRTRNLSKLYTYGCQSSGTFSQEQEQKLIFTLSGSRSWEALKPNAYHHLLATGWQENGGAGQPLGRSLTRAFWPTAALPSSLQGQSPSALAWRDAQHHYKLKLVNVAYWLTDTWCPFSCLLSTGFCGGHLVVIDGEKKQLLCLHVAHYLAITGKKSFYPWLLNTISYEQTNGCMCIS